jgi:hypothetical protein
MSAAAEDKIKITDFWLKIPMLAAEVEPMRASGKI